MDKVMTNGFVELSENEIEAIDGGFVIALVVIGASTYAITSGMVYTAVGVAWGAGTVGYQIYNAFRK